MTDVCCSKPEIEFRRGLSYNYESWFDDRHWPSEERDVNQSETGNKIALQRSPS